eukprot:NODE_362_length_2362_cov_25.551232_g337_i0.p2 GENE.NODE_362_length_2362_cov_25.551232_g337_i0~~NODE_362_length_2362_cov_25.551232_g337_i0.p2  ORF type:complete len:407 (-),score=82.02 NODE_362_length_2362_cov_25.551232_g337_i0:33-1253(-)
MARLEEALRACESGRGAVQSNAFQEEISGQLSDMLLLVQEQSESARAHEIALHQMQSALDAQLEREIEPGRMQHLEDSIDQLNNWARQVAETYRRSWAGERPADLPEPGGAVPDPLLERLEASVSQLTAEVEQLPEQIEMTARCAERSMQLHVDEVLGELKGRIEFSVQSCAALRDEISDHHLALQECMDVLAQRCSNLEKGGRALHRGTVLPRAPSPAPPSSSSDRIPTDLHQSASEDVRESNVRFAQPTMELPPPGSLPSYTHNAAPLRDTRLQPLSSNAPYLQRSEMVRLGIDVQPAAESGVIVTKVTPGSYGAQAGLQIGDVIISLNGIHVDTRDEFQLAERQLCASVPSVVVSLLKWGSPRDLTVCLPAGGSSSGKSPPLATSAVERSESPVATSWVRTFR